MRTSRKRASSGTSDPVQASDVAASEGRPAACMFPHTSWPPAQATEPSQNVWIEFAKWVLRDHHRCAWAFATVVVVLLATVTAAGLLAPYLGDLGGLLGGGIVGGGLGLGGGLVARRTRRLTPGEE